MTPPGDHPSEQLPAPMRVLLMLRARVPDYSWDARRVILTVEDFQDLIDVDMVAARCADWLLGPDSTRVRDAPAQLRRYMEKEKEQRAPNVSPMRGKLRAYSRPVVAVERSMTSSASSKPPSV